jgi:hypothetical protein
MNDREREAAEIEAFGKLVDSFVQYFDANDVFPSDGLNTKIDLLERAIELWRFHNLREDNGVELEHFLQGRILVDDSRMFYEAPDRLSASAAGTRPVLLQPNLLFFLLVFHRDRLKVYDIIHRFIEKMRPQLTLLDFKKTKTGVTRCYTNTRFAALTLRNYGFLKFTRREAYKVWELSLTGFLAASKLRADKPGWTLEPFDAQRVDLHPAISEASKELDHYDKFVHRLASICEPDVKVFRTFEEVLRKAFRLLPSYWETLGDPMLTQKQRHAATTQRIAELEHLPQMTNFYQEFSACVRVDLLLKDVK